MRYTIAHIKIVDNLPECPNCGATTVFANAADVGKDGRVNLIFRCTNCSAGETKVWKPEYQAMADLITSDD